MNQMSRAADENSTHDAPQPQSGTRRGRIRPAIELGLALALWQRDMLRLMKERSRWLGVVAQPMLLWLLLGTGMASTFRLEGVELDYLTYFFPGVCGMVILFTTIFATMAVIEDRNEGFLQQVLTSPGSRHALVLGKCAGVSTVALIQVVLCALIAPAAGYPLGGIDWPVLIVTTLLGAAGLTGLSFMFAWVINSTHGYHAIMAVLLLPLWLISGAMFPVTSGWIAKLAVANPMTYVVDGFRHAFSSGESSLATTGPTLTIMVLGIVAVTMFSGASFLAHKHRTAR